MKFAYLFVVSALITASVMIHDVVMMISHWGDFENYSGFGHTYIVVGGMLMIGISLIGMLISAIWEDKSHENKIKKTKVIGRDFPYYWR